MKIKFTEAQRIQRNCAAVLKDKDSTLECCMTEGAGAQAHIPEAQVQFPVPDGPPSTIENDLEQGSGIEKVCYTEK